MKIKSQKSNIKYSWKFRLIKIHDIFMQIYDLWLMKTSWHGRLLHAHKYEKDIKIKKIIPVSLILI